MGNDEEIYKKENAIKGAPDSLSSENLEQALFQMKNCVCKIKYKDIAGTGFFCKIRSKSSFNLIPTLITCYHVLGKTIIKKKKIDISLNNERISYSLSFDIERRFYIDEKTDVAIIEIKPEIDNIKDEQFLDLDDNIFNENPNEIYRNKSVYVIYYPLYENEKKVKYSLGTIKCILEDNYSFFHFCPTQTGSSGGPIINLSNLKVMGVHKGAKKDKSFNLGTLMRIPIEEFLSQATNNSNRISTSLKKSNILNQSTNIQLLNQSKILNQSNTLRQSINIDHSNYLKIVNQSEVLKKRQNESYNKSYKNINQINFNKRPIQTEINEIKLENYGKKSLSPRPNKIYIKPNNINLKEGFNNIIYYDENKNDLYYLYKMCDHYEKNTNGGFFLCTDLESLSLISEEIIYANRKNKNTIFNLIISGVDCEKVIHYLNKNKEFEKCIKSIVVYCQNIDEYNPLKQKYKIISDVCNDPQDIDNYIYMTSSKEIKPYPIAKLITYKDYINYYKCFHYKIAKYYGDLTPKSYATFINKINSLIIEDGKNNDLTNINQNQLLQSFFVFDTKNDKDNSNKLIIKEYTKDTFYSDLNRWLTFPKKEYYDTIAYFSSRLMYCLNSYIYKNVLYNENCKYLYRVLILPYSCLLPYIRAKGNIITFSNFISTSENEEISKKYLIYNKTDYKFSVSFKIKNDYINNWIPNAINIKSVYDNFQNEFIFLPFTFFHVKDVKIDIKNHTAEIFLKTIGKKEILEMQIKNNKEIEYNQNENIIQIKRN